MPREIQVDNQSQQFDENSVPAYLQFPFGREFNSFYNSNLTAVFNTISPIFQYRRISEFTIDVCGNFSANCDSMRARTYPGLHKLKLVI
jgi:hypothetical protein